MLALVSVRVFAKNRLKGSRHLAALFVCALLVFFAVAAKLSLYAPQTKDMQALSATKVWQDDAGHGVPTLPVFQAVLVATCAIVLLAKPLSFEEHISLAESRQTKFEWFSPDLFVRPPPAL
jgi:hypothetical protein